MCSDQQGSTAGKISQTYYENLIKLKSLSVCRSYNDEVKNHKSCLVKLFDLFKLLNHFDLFRPTFGY